MLHIDIEVCHNCQKHSWFTQHNPKRYEKIYNLFTIALRKEYPEIAIQKNYIPPHLTRIISKNLSEEVYYDPITEEIKTIPRIGAFEITIFGRTIFSKLKMGVWPHIPFVIALIKELVQGFERGEDLDDLIKRNSKTLLKTTSGSGSLIQSTSVNNRKKKESANSVARTTKLESINNNNNLGTKRLLKPNAENNTFMKLRSKTPEPERLNSTKSSLRKTANSPFLSVKLSTGKTGPKQNKQTPDAENKFSNEQNRSFRIHRFSATKSGKKVLVNDNSSHCLSVLGQGSVLNSTVLESNLNETFTNTPQARLLIDVGGSAQDYQIKQLLSTQDTEEQYFQNQLYSQGEIKFPHAHSMEAEDLINKYGLNNEIDTDFLAQIRNHGIQKTGFSQLMRNLRIHPPSRDHPQADSGKMLHYPDSFRANQTIQTQNQLFSQPFHLEQSTTIYETPKYAETKDFFGPTELQKTAQLVRNSQFSQDSEAFEDKRPPSRGLNRHIKRLEPTDIPVQSAKIYSANFTVGDYLQSEDNQLTFRNTSDEYPITQVNAPNEFTRDNRSKISVKEYFAKDLSRKDRESNENKSENQLFKENDFDEAKLPFRRKKYQTPDRRKSRPAFLRSNNNIQ